MLKCVIFDLDGVLVTTDELHYQAWKAIAEKLKVPFDRMDNMRQRGVSRMESLEIILEKCNHKFTDEEKFALAEEKNNIYKESLKRLSANDALPAVRETLEELNHRGILKAVGSSSKNAPEILERTHLTEYMDAVVSGLDITHSKPHPEVFSKAGTCVSCQPEECLVVEDAEMGVRAGKAAGMRVMAVGAASDNQEADFRFESLKEAFSSWDDIIRSFD